jgi:putative peptidoglycan lipid II flippase
LPASNLHWAGLRRGLSYTVYGYSVLALAPIIEQVLAGRLGSGGIASLGYASRVTALATGLVVTAINRVSLPHFSGLSGSAASVYSGLGPIASGSLLLGVAMMLGLSFLAQPLVALIFERGNFLPDDTVVVANLLRWNLTQLGPYFLSVVLSAWLAAQSRFREIFIACMVGFVMRVSFAWLGASHFGLNAVAAAATVGYVAMCAYLCWATLMRGATSGRLRTGSKNSE